MELLQARELCREGVDATLQRRVFFVHGVDVEGTRVGIDDALVTLLGDCSPVPVTYAGGAAALGLRSR